jgi:diguanylate cyclase (GGDEF)-like protein
MSQARFRKSLVRRKNQTQFNVLLLGGDASYASVLKQALESRLPVVVTVVHTLEQAKKLLQQKSETFFIGITSIDIASVLDLSAFKNVDLLGEFNLPVIVVVDQYEDEIRDQLIKRHVIDYVVKGNKFDSAYICDLIARVIKNCDIKVLVVDDSKVSRFILERELALQKFEVVQSKNGLEALEKLSEYPDIKLVLVDSKMAVMDGYTFVEQARYNHSKEELIIIGVSGSSDPRIAVKFLKAGANDFIAKPFNYEMLLCRISRNLDMLDAIELARSLSNIDYLSGLYNRRYFFEQGGKLLASLEANGQANGPLTVMMMDIDNFKKINDGHGHDVGDLVIKNFASLLKIHFPGDIVARIGGEEFTVISQSPQYLKSLGRVDAFRKSVENEEIQLDGITLQYTCCIGVCNEIGDDLDGMVIQADKNLYKAKQAGKNQVCG